VKSQA
jgi:hypothetical protein